MMSPSTSRLTELPVEILEKILLHLPGQDIIKIEAVRRAMVMTLPTRLCVDFSATRSRSVDNSETWLIVHQHFGTDVNSSPPGWSTIPTALATWKNAKDCAKTMYTNGPTQQI